MDYRASDTEREQTAERLRHAAGEGRLTVEELDDRLQAALTAATRAELERLTDDVPAASPAVVAAPQPVSVVRGDSGEARLVAIMGGIERTGRWRIARQCRALAIMGGIEIDLNDAELGDAVVDLRVTAIMGGVELRVPEGLNVEVSTTGVMGGTEVEIGDHHPSPGGPLLRLRVTAVMGGVEVTRGRKAPRASLRPWRRTSG